MWPPFSLVWEIYFDFFLSLAIIAHMSEPTKNPAAVALGSMTSDRKAASSRENAKKPRPSAQGKPKKRKPLEEFKCECGQCDDGTPRTYCPRGRAIIRRQKEAVGK